jgi:hypothetical protein
MSMLVLFIADETDARLDMQGIPSSKLMPRKNGKD